MTGPGGKGATGQSSEPEGGRSRLVTRVLLIALILNGLAWLGASLGPAAHAAWRPVSLLTCVGLGFAIGRWWALLVTCAFGAIHAVPVYLGLLPGYLSTWGELAWWLFALTLLVGLTALGVLARQLAQWLWQRVGPQDA